MSVDTDELIVDKRIDAALTSLTPEEFRLLEEQCIAAGAIKDSIKTWGDTGIIVDGHHRYKIAKKHDLPYYTESLDFDSVEDVILWVHKNQLGRRNLQGVALTLSRANITRSMEDSKKGESQRKAAEALGVSDRQIRRDLKTAETVDALPEDIKERIATSNVVASQRDIARLSELESAQIAKACNKLRADATLGLHEVLPKPEKKKHNLSAADLAIVDEHFDKEVRRMIHQGSLNVTPGEIVRVMQLKPIKRQAVFDIITANDDIETISAAMKFLKNPSEPKDVALEIAKKNEQGVQYTDKLIRIVDDLFALKGTNGGKPHNELIEKLKLIRKQFSA